MKSLQKFSENFFYQIDFFKFPFCFTINSERTKISSKLGSFYSLAIIGTLFYFFLTSPMFSKQSPSVLSQNIPQMTRKDVHLKNSDFKLTYGIYDRLLRGYQIDDSIFSVRINLTNVYIDPNRSSHLITHHPKTFPCPSSNKISYCLEDFDFPLKGYLNNDSTMIGLSLFLCNNETSNNSCQSLEKIQNFLSGKYFAISFADRTIDFNNYEEPAESFIQKVFFVLDVNNYKNTAIYFKNVEIYDDDNIFFYDSQLKMSTYMKDYTVSDFSNGMLQNSNNPLAEFQLYSSENLFQIKRSYQKLGQMLAFLSGIFSLLKFMGSFIIHLRVKYKIQNKIMNFLYDLDFGHVKRKFNVSVQTTKKEEKSIQKEAHQTNKFSVLHPQPELWIKFKKEFNKIMSLFFDQNYQEEYLNLINLRTIFKCLHDIQKMKILLFNSQQLKLFDQMKRPKISIANQTSTKTIVDPGLKLLDLMRYSYRADTKRSKRDESKIPNTLDEKLNFFNSIKCPINV